MQHVSYHAQHMAPDIRRLMPGVTTAMNTSDAAFVVLGPTAFGAAKAFVVLPPATGRPMISHVGHGNDYVGGGQSS